MQLFFYCVCGGMGVASDLGLYLVLIYYDVDYQAANIFGYSLGTLVSFSLNRLITFCVKDKVFHRLAFFIAVAALGYCLSAIMLWLLVDVAGFQTDLSKVATLPLVLVLQFTLNRYVTFRESGS